MALFSKNVGAFLLRTPGHSGKIITQPIIFSPAVAAVSTGLRSSSSPSNPAATWRVRHRRPGLENGHRSEGEEGRQGQGRWPSRQFKRRLLAEIDKKIVMFVVYENKTTKFFMRSIKMGPSALCYTNGKNN